MTDNSPNNTMAASKSSQELARVELASWLKMARERSGLSIEAISQETRISKSYILHLEAGKLEALPGKVFGRGFVKNITRLLKSDTNECLRLYDACWGTSAPVANDESIVEGQTPEVHKTKSVQARIAEPLKINTPVTERLINTDFPQAGEKPRLPSKSLSSKVRTSISLPAWLVRGVVSPHIRLWILAGIATVFVGLVFGRWAAGNLHKSRLAERSAKVETAGKIQSSDGKIMSSADMSALDQEKPMDDATSLTTAVSETVRLNSVKTETASIDGSAAAATNDLHASSVARDRSIPAEDDNPLYMPSSGAAFEQIVEFKVASDTEMRVTLDGKKQEKTNFSPETYRFTFNDRAEIYIMDASIVDVIYNGKSLGVLGNKGRKRRIFLQAKASSSDFPQ